MAVKTITIDMAAYELLSAETFDDESFSKVIKRRLRPASTARSLLEALPQYVLSDETLEHTETVVRSRADSPALSPVIDTLSCRRSLATFHGPTVTDDGQAVAFSPPARRRSSGRRAPVAAAKARRS